MALKCVRMICSKKKKKKMLRGIGSRFLAFAKAIKSFGNNNNTNNNNGV